MTGCLEMFALGIPATGKSMLAKRLITILPPPVHKVKAAPTRLRGTRIRK